MRILLIGLTLVAALLNAGCTYYFDGSRWWACGTVTMSDGQQVSGCQPLPDGVSPQ
jgi:hypothetical protein